MHVDDVLIIVESRNEASVTSSLSTDIAILAITQILDVGKRSIGRLRRSELVLIQNWRLHIEGLGSGKSASFEAASWH